jgi:hypothetical protein
MYISDVMRATFPVISFLSTFATLQNAIVTSCLRMDNSAASGRIFMKFWVFSKICPVRSDLIKIWRQWRVLYMKTDVHMVLPPGIFLRITCFRQKLQRLSKHMFYVKLSPPENLALYEMMWKNMVERDRLQLKIYTAHVNFRLDN